MNRDIVEAIFYTLSSITDQGIHVIDKEGRTIFYNDSMALLEGLDKEKVLDRSLLEIFPSLTEETSTLLRALKTGCSIVDRVQTYVNNQGRTITTINTSVPVKLRGEIVGALEIARDITVLTELSEKVILLQQREKSETKNAYYTFEDIIGDSPKLKEAIKLAKKVAPSSSTVLLIGETGTGKELFAQSIHSASPRRHKPFIAQNCAAIPEGLLEGLLFGTTKGAFTGATDRPGLFEMADGGTLLLDEINSMGLNLQAKLLRVLQDSTIRRIGGSQDIRVNVRIIATTNSDPEELVRKEELRPDLYYRLNTFPIEIPALRERKEDIPLLIGHFIAKYNSILGSRIKKASPQIENLLKKYNWPGNVRELENVIQASANLALGEDELKPEHLPQYLLRILTQSKDAGESPEVYDYSVPLNEYIQQVEKQILEKALEESNYNISQTARRLSIKRQLLQYKIKKYGIELPF